MEFYIKEKLIVRVPVVNIGVNVTRGQFSFIVSFFRNKDFDLSLKEFRNRFSQVYGVLTSQSIYHECSLLHEIL